MDFILGQKEAFIFFSSRGKLLDLEETCFEMGDLLSTGFCLLQFLILKKRRITVECRMSDVQRSVIRIPIT